MKPETKRYGFTTFFKEDGLYYFQFNDREGEPLLYSHGYQSEKSRDNGIQSVLRYAGEDDLYEQKKTKKGQRYFVLKASNYQEIGRSRMFDSKEEMEEKIELLQGLDEEIPVFDVAEADEKRETEKDQERMVQEIPQPEETGSMPRYKFSVIYYPDSDVWMLRHDFSGNAKKLETCDGKQIVDFLRSHLPEEKKKTAEGVDTPLSEQREIPARQSMPEIKDKGIQHQVEMKIRDIRGATIGKIARSGELGQIEIIPKAEINAPAQTFETTLLVKSLAENKTVMVEEARSELKHGRLFISIWEANNLHPGMYRFTVSLHPSGETKESDLSESQLLMLN